MTHEQVLKHIEAKGNPFYDDLKKEHKEKKVVPKKIVVPDHKPTLLVDKEKAVANEIEAAKLQHHITEQKIQQHNAKVKKLMQVDHYL